jgi:hypothetical protein
MSDGPHKSLPMRRPWRDLSERAAKAAFSPDQVGEALPRALKREFTDAPIKAVRDILGGGPQSSLFPSERLQQLEALRSSTYGSAAANSLIDCAIDVVREGRTGEAATTAAIANALDEQTRSAFRSVEEHYQRKAGSRDATFVRNRLNAAREGCDYGSLAAELASDSSPRAGRALPKKSDVDEGPAL